MKKLLFLLVLAIPFTLQAKYKFDETLFIPLEQTGVWKKGKESATDEGAAVTRYMLESETQNNWSKLLTIQFKDRQLVHGATALEAMQAEQSMSAGVDLEVVVGQPNDVLYSRSFPSGEHEIVRMVMTKKGLHRAAYVKRGAFDPSERALWIERLKSGVVGR